MSGVRFTFDPSQPAGKRVDSRLIQVQGEYLDLEEVFSCGLFF